MNKKFVLLLLALMLSFVSTGGQIEESVLVKNSHSAVERAKKGSFDITDLNSAAETSPKRTSTRVFTGKDPEIPVTTSTIASSNRIQ